MTKCYNCERELDPEDYMVSHMCPYCFAVLKLKEDLLEW